MLDQLMSQMQEQTKEVEKKLDSIVVTGEAENGLVKVSSTGNKRIVNIEISDEIAGDKEAIEDLVIVAVNRAIKKAEEVHEKEMGSIAQGMLPGMGDLGELFGK